MKDFTVVCMNSTGNADDLMQQNKTKSQIHLPILLKNFQLNVIESVI